MLAALSLWTAKHNSLGEVATGRWSRLFKNSRASKTQLAHRLYRYCNKIMVCQDYVSISDTLGAAEIANRNAFIFQSRKSIGTVKSVAIDPLALAEREESEEDDYGGGRGAGGGAGFGRGAAAGGRGAGGVGGWGVGERPSVSSAKPSQISQGYGATPKPSIVASAIATFVTHPEME